MSTRDLHPDVRLAVAVLETELGHVLELSREADNAEYGAAIARADGLRFRVGKVTPTKAGHFVTVWRRAADGSTEPLPGDDGVAALIVAVRDDAGVGMFALPAAALVEHGVASVRGVGGKRGFRLYPSWVDAPNRQAARSQEWQTRYFRELR